MDQSDSALCQRRHGCRPVPALNSNNQEPKLESVNPQDFESFMERIPLAGHLGFACTVRTPTETTLTMPVDPRHLQIDGRVHGGIVSTLADTSAVWLLLQSLDPGEHLTSIEFKLNFLAGARAGDGPLASVASIVRRGRQIAVAEVSVFQAAKMVSKGLFTYLVFKGAERPTPVSLEQNPTFPLDNPSG